jgi:glycosyltransferase involved in cell wall biosynthesis
LKKECGGFTKNTFTKRFKDLKRIVCFGPGPQFKGGISNYNTSLAKAFDKLHDTEVHIVSWTQQYPAIIPREFIDKSSKKDLLEGSNIKVKYLTNYNRPRSWKKTYQYIRDLRPDKVIFQWSIAIQGLPLGRIAKMLSKHPEIEVVFDLHFVVQKENSSIDRRFTKFGIKHAHTFVVHALKTYNELTALFPERAFFMSISGERAQDEKTTVIKLYHPIYDLFKADPNFDVADFKAKHGLNKHVFLFFGFIRKYKGLHQAIAAFAKVAEQREDVSFLICGESFWNTLEKGKWSTQLKNLLFSFAKALFLKKEDDEKHYNPLQLIQQYGLESKTMVVNQFVPNEEVPQYFQVSDNVVLYYLTATPSGVESLSYNFNMPILATNVGHFPETIKDGYNGYLATSGDTASMAEVMLKSITAPIDRNNVAESTKEMSWENYAKAILRD